MKANEGQKRPAKSITSKVFDIINIHGIIINKCEFDTKKKVFRQTLKFSFLLHKLLEITFC